MHIDRRTCCQLSSRKVDAQSVINWTVVGQLINNTSELRRSTTLVYRRDRQALSTARFCRAGQLATAGTCCNNWLTVLTSMARLSFILGTGRGAENAGREND